MIAPRAIVVTAMATLVIVAFLLVAVYDPARMAGMSRKQRVALCLRQLSSSWPWR